MKKPVSDLSRYWFLLLLLAAACSDPAPDSTRRKEDCLVCDRLLLFEQLRAQVAEAFWPSFGSDKITPPLVYFTDSQSWLAFSQVMLFNDPDASRKECPSGTVIYRMSKRADAELFHLENRMTFSDSARPYFNNPMLYCSGPESTRQRIPATAGTEEWLQLAMHEYFHAFQFSNERTVSFLTDSVRVTADSLDRICERNAWFRDLLVRENGYLLQAISVSTDDSARIFCNRFWETRKLRRKRFSGQYGYSIGRDEKFWETIEGCARYIEYNMGYVYMNSRKGELLLECDTLFRNFDRYKTGAFLQEPAFTEKTTVGKAYYLATGFNLCRVMDRLHIGYKAKVTDDGLLLEDVFGASLMPSAEQYEAPVDLPAQ